MRRRSLVPAVLSGALWSSSKVIASAIATPVFARMLGPEGYGQFAYYVGILFVASPFADGGISWILPKELSEHGADLPRRRALITFCARLQATTAPLVWLLVGLFLAYFAPGPEPSGRVATALIALLAGEALWRFSRGVLYGMHQEATANTAATLGAVLAPVFGVALVAAGSGVAGVLGGLAAGSLITGTLALARALPFLRPACAADAGGPPPALPAARLLRFGASSVLFSALTLGLYRADAILVRHFSNDTQAGLYAAAVQWSEFVWFVAIAAEAVMLQTAAPHWAARRIDEITTLVARAVRWVVLVTTHLLLVVGILAEPILEVYFGGDFAQAATVMRLLVPGVLAFAVARVMGPVIQARGRVGTMVAVIATGTALNVLLNLLLLPTWGAMGSAIATTVTYGGVALTYLVTLRREGVSPLRDLRLARLGLLAVATAAALLLVRTLLAGPIAVVAVGGALATLVYWAGALWIGVVDGDELRGLLDAMPQGVREPGQRLVARMGVR